MPSMVGYCATEPEARTVRRIARELAARLDDSEWNIAISSSLGSFSAALADSTNAELGCIDLRPETAISAAEEFRRVNGGAKLLLIADAAMSPVRYLRPCIMASSLLLHPYSEGQMAEAVWELMSGLRTSDDAGSFTVATKSERIRLAYADIDYFEARDKRIFVCCKGREYAFYSTLEQLTSELPPMFVRCHKGYIINRGRIRSISFSDSCVTLATGYTIPISRSYRSAMREIGNE